MRELIFELDYHPGWNPVADTLVDYPDATIRSLSCHVTDDTLWRVDHISGSSDALATLETAYETADYFPDCLVTEDCEATSRTHILDCTAESLVIYCVWERSDVCTSVPHLAYTESAVEDLEEQGTEPDGGFEDATPRSDIDEPGPQDAETPLERIYALPEHVAERELTANQERARFIAQDVRDYAEKCPGGLVLDSTTITKVLTASEGNRPHTQTVARVMKFLNELGKNTVELKKRRGRKLVMFDPEYADRLTNATAANHGRCDESQRGPPTEDVITG